MAAARLKRRPLSAQAMAPWLLVLALAPEAEGVAQSGLVCQVPSGYAKSHLVDIAVRNCERVNQTSRDIAQAIAEGKERSEAQRAVWENRSAKAMSACKVAREKLVLDTSASVNEATDFAINAWGSVLTAGRECCVLLGPPYCVDSTWSTSSVAIMTPFLVLFALGIGSSITAYCLPRKSKPKPRGEGLDREDTAQSVRSARATPRAHAGENRLRTELCNAWLQRSCLRTLPSAPVYAEASASLFGAMRETFDFQADNVRNQYEHLISLWRSQCAMVADRSVGEGVQVDERGLLAEALGDLHAEVLDGFCRWRTKFSEHEATRMSKGAAPSLGGVEWEQLKVLESGAAGAAEGDLSPEQIVWLAEIATYLLVWGEAGNVRFMPEVIYFVTELALAAEDIDVEVYGGVASPRDHRGAGPFRSGRFLSKIMRPIYNVVFDEWYDYVGVDKGSQKDKKKLRDGLENFLPADVANYDDWNEFFCDPDRLAQGLLLQDGTRLFDLPHSKRFAALSRVDWQVSLEASETKTHRELHSLWGVFASTHRVWLVHALLFFMGICAITGEPPETPDGRQPLGGRSFRVRFAAVGLIVPIHAMLWRWARWQVTGRAIRLQRRFCGCAAKGLLKTIGWLLPLVTYAGVRLAYTNGGNIDISDRFDRFTLDFCLVVHYLVSAIGLFILLFVPAGVRYNFWTPTKVPLHVRAIRYTFWFVVLGFKFFMASIIFSAVFKATVDLRIALPGHQSVDEIREVYFSANWGGNVLLWFVMWFTTFVLFVSDTQLWFTILGTFLGVATVFVQRGRQCFKYTHEDAIAKIPERFSKKVLTYAPAGAALHTDKEVAPFSAAFPLIWDRIIEYMRYEDKIDNQHMGDLSFRAGDAGRHVYWQQLCQPLGRSRGRIAPGIAEGGGGSEASGVACITSSDATTSRSPAVAAATVSRRVKVPDVFREKTPPERFFKHYMCVPDQHWPQNPDVQWRILALARGLGLPMPRPFRMPYMPGITVLIPHYGESILMMKKELFQEGKSDVVPLMDWVKQFYGEEFSQFTGRMQAKNGGGGWPVAGSQWDEYTDTQWDKINTWSAMRLQTLWRTVGGMCLYHPALQCHYEAQADRSSRLAQPGIWDPSDLFTCLVSMQMYKFFDQAQLMHTNRMFEKFPDCLKVAFIDCEDKGISGECDSVHPWQKRRYFSALIDRGCKQEADGSGRRVPRLRIELPGYPILGDGKGDNQNHAIPFMRGPFAQCIDANQGAYFEQMMLLPCALGEFRSAARGDGLSKRIIGFPEHITSDIGSIGDFAASAEVAFGTILQRSYAALGARMHYGHPDIMNKLFMMQQGGVSKATKTLNLSEDIFAGMDFTLRGEERLIHHREYFHLAKGRDLGFNTVLGFFSKLSSGTGEQVLSRQTFRLGQVLHLPEALTFYYAHVGYYFTQAFVSWSMPLLVFVWLLVLLSDCEAPFQSFQQQCQADNGQVLPAAKIMAEALALWFSWLLLLFLVATSLPLVAEMWMQRSLKIAIVKWVKQQCTLSFLLFIFQAKIIGHYVVNELRYGGATYVSTGRGLPTERRPFIGEAAERGFKLTKVGGLYLDYASIAYYDGATLLTGTVLILAVGGHSGAGGASGDLVWIFISLTLTIVSWLYAPFIFNPYQFSARHFGRDFRCLVSFFLEDSGRHWVEWYDRTQLKPGQGVHQSAVDIAFFGTAFFLAAWYALVNIKVEALEQAYSELANVNRLYIETLLPPLGASIGYCVLAVLAESLMGCSSILRRRLRRPKRSRAATLRLHGLTTVSLPSAARSPSRFGARSPSRLVEEVAAGDEEEGRKGESEEEKEQEEEAVEGDEDEEEEEDQEEQAHTTAEDHAVAPAPPPRGKTTRMSEEVGGRLGCRLGIPLSFSAVMVFCFDVIEAVVTLRDLWWVGWKHAFLAGLILKWGLLMLCVTLGEGVLRSRCFGCAGRLGLPVQLWVRAHRMVRDILTSSLIFWALFPFVVLNELNEFLCPGCSTHQLLIYRDPGHLARKEAVVVDLLDDTAAPTDWGGDLEMSVASEGDTAPVRSEAVLGGRI